MEDWDTEQKKREEEDGVDLVPKWFVWVGSSMFVVAMVGGSIIGASLDKEEEEKVAFRQSLNIHSSPFQLPKGPEPPLSRRARVNLGLGIFKSFFYGTALAVGTGAVITYATAYYLDAWTPRKLARAIRWVCRLLP